MTKPNDGGPAFPHMAADGHQDYRRGLSVRDYFAAKAMQGVLAGDHPITREDDCLELIAMAAYEQADAMLAARDKKAEGTAQLNVDAFGTIQP